MEALSFYEQLKASFLSRATAVAEFESFLVQEGSQDLISACSGSSEDVDWEHKAQAGTEPFIEQKDWGDTGQDYPDTLKLECCAESVTELDGRVCEEPGGHDALGNIICDDLQKDASNGLNEALEGHTESAAEVDCSSMSTAEVLQSTNIFQPKVVTPPDLATHQEHSPLRNNEWWRGDARICSAQKGSAVPLQATIVSLHGLQLVTNPDTKGSSPRKEMGRSSLLGGGPQRNPSLHRDLDRQEMEQSLAIGAVVQASLTVDIHYETSQERLGMSFLPESKNLHSPIVACRPEACQSLGKKRKIAVQSQSPKHERSASRPGRDAEFSEVDGILMKAQNMAEQLVAVSHKLYQQAAHRGKVNTLKENLGQAAAHGSWDQYQAARHIIFPLQHESLVPPSKCLKAVIATAEYAIGCEQNVLSFCPMQLPSSIYCDFTFQDSIPV